MLRVLLHTSIILLISSLLSVSLHAQSWNFDDDLEDWHIDGDGEISLTDERAYEGENSAMITGDDGAGSFDFQIDTNEPTPGYYVTYRVWVDEESHDEFEALNLFAMVDDWDWNDEWVDIGQLEAGEWNDVTFQIPEAEIVERIGFQVHRESAEGTSSPIYVDHITVDSEIDDEDPEEPGDIITTWDFEEDLGNWQVTDGGTAEHSGARAYEGDYSALVMADEEAEATNFENEDFAEITPGDEVTFRVWVSEDDLALFDALQPFSRQEESSWNALWVDDIEAEQWMEITFEIPDQGEINSFGLQAYGHDGQAPEFYVDHITVREGDVPPPPEFDTHFTWDFETVSPEGWDPAGASVNASDNYSYSGIYSIALTADNDEPFWQYDVDEDNSLEPLHTIHYRIYIPEEDFDKITLIQAFHMEGEGWEWYDTNFDPAEGEVTPGEWNTVTHQLNEDFSDDVLQRIGIKYDAEYDEDPPTMYIDFISTDPDAPIRPHLSIPDGLAASNITNTSLDLTWNEPAEGDDEVEEYVVYRGDRFADDIGDFDEIARTEETDYSDSGLLHGTHYSYRVAAMSTDSLYTIASDAESVVTESIEFETHATWDYETVSPEGWDVSGGSADIEDEIVYSGMYSVEITAGDDTDETFWQTDDPQDEGVLPQHNVHYRIWISEEDLEMVDGFQAFHQHGEGWVWEAEWIDAEDVTPDEWNTLVGQIVEEFEEEDGEPVLQRIGFQMVLHETADQPTYYVDFISTDPEAMVRPHLSIPEGLTVSDEGSQTVALSWSASEGDDELDEYKVYRGDEEAEDLEDFEEIARTSNTTYEDVVETGDQAYRYRVSAISTDDRETLPSEYAEITVTSSEEEAGVPDEFALHDNYPNPFNPSTNIQYDLPEQATVTLRVYNVMGQLVQTLVDNVEQQPGQHTIEFDASDLASGVYIYRIEAGNFSQTRQMMFIK